MASEETKREGSGAVVGKRAMDFILDDHEGNEVSLREACKVAPVMLVFYPGDFTPVCTKQLCNYRDNMSQFAEMGIQIFGISGNGPEEHKKFASEYNFPFLLLSDPGKSVAKKFGCTSLLMFGGVSRAVFIINTDMLILYRYVEPTSLSRRSADELLGILRDLRSHKLI